jgi:hypothetical protein
MIYCLGVVVGLRLGALSGETGLGVDEGTGGRQRVVQCQVRWFPVEAHSTRSRCRNGGVGW